MAKFKITEKQKKSLEEGRKHNNPFMFGVITDLGNPLYWQMLNEEQNLNEGLIKTYPPETTLRYIKGLYNLKDEQIACIDSRAKEAGDESKKFAVFIKNTKELVDSIKKAFDLCGYTLSIENYIGENVLLQFIPKYSGEITDKVQEIGHLVHITPVYNKESILKNGLSPRLKNNMFIHNGRIYFFPNDRRLYREIHFQMDDFEKNLKNKRNNQVWTLFTITVDKLKNTKFFFDPNYLYGIYTYDNIPPSAITGYVDVDLKQNPFGLK